MSTKTYSNTASLASSSSSSTISDSDDFLGINSSSSFDRSSVGSIPWAEDAVKQNQLEWERLERIFYGEEDLPTNDPDLRSEILQWTEAFPHLRVNGKRYLINPVTVKGNGHQEKRHDEILAIDPLPDHRFSPRYLRPINNAYTNMHKIDEELSQFADKDLRISSVPMISKRRQVPTKQSKSHNVLNRKPNFEGQRGNSIIPENSQRRMRLIDPVFSSKSSSHWFHNISHQNFYGRGVAGRGKSSSNSAQIVRMPPIVNFAQNLYLPQTKQIYVATARPTNKNPVVLPSLNLNQLDANSDLAGRSISAAFNTRRISSFYLTNSASKLKTFK